jgi:hypothetical protein
LELHDLNRSRGGSDHAILSDYAGFPLSMQRLTHAQQFDLETAEKHRAARPPVQTIDPSPRPPRIERGKINGPVGFREFSGSRCQRFVLRHTDGAPSGKVLQNTRKDLRTKERQSIVHVV